MEDMGPKPRINGSMLGTYQGKYVTLIGRAHDPDQNGMGFRLEISDGKDINVKLQEPLQELVEGAVQVQGLTDGKNLVNATYVDLPEGKNSFDLNQYDQAVRYLNSLQEVVIPQVPSMSQSQ